MLKHVTYRSTSSLGRASSDLTCRGQMSPDTVSLKGDLPPTPDLPIKSATLSRTPDSMMRYKEQCMSPDTISLRSPDTISLRDEGFERSPDSFSLHSTLSFTSLAAGRLSSRCSSTASLNDNQTTPVKVYLRSLRPDIEYKTCPLTSATTCRELIAWLLAKYRIKHRDPNLFFVTMEVMVRGPGSAPVKRILVLDDNARPAELQQCRPRGEARFSVGVRRGGLLRIHDSILMPGSQYKSLLVSYRTTSEELTQLLLNCYGNKESPKHYAVHEVCKTPYGDRQLRPDEHPLLVQSEWSKKDKTNYSFVLRRNIAYALSLKSRMSWRRSLDQSSTDTESEHDIEDHNTTSASLFSASSVSSALSLSSNASSMSSSSGVSSASSSMSSPAQSPMKPRSLPIKENMASTPEKNIINSNMNIINMTSSLPPRPVPRTLFSLGPTATTIPDLSTLIINEVDTPSSESESTPNPSPICTKPCCFKIDQAATQSTPTKNTPTLSTPTSTPTKSLPATPKSTPKDFLNRSLPSTPFSYLSRSVPSTPESKSTSTLPRPNMIRSVSSTRESTPVSSTLPRPSMSKSTTTLASCEPTPSLQRRPSLSSSTITLTPSPTAPQSKLMHISDLLATPRRPSVTRSTITLTLVKTPSPRSIPTATSTPTSKSTPTTPVKSPESTTSTLTPQSAHSTSMCSCCNHYENCFYI
ncbi:unnamed protein product [Meganyctiphanes norvegica]|uniref:Ras-associating domain-containing protein n=1 Tax=Meganyctiphanes norvegica TaxID=48144 RepID=A0AAV2QB55_MEGNR